MKGSAGSRPAHNASDKVHNLVRAHFDEPYYVGKYDDVRRGVESGEIPDPVAHYLSIGWREGRDPAPEFSTTDYLRLNPELRSVDVAPYVHFLQVGRLEGRKTRVVSAPEMIVHCGHHRCGTLWFDRILRKLSRYTGLTYFHGLQSELPADTSIFFENHSRVRLDDLPPRRGSHIRRDPRDILVSGYFYHLWSDETWLHVPQDRFGGLTYQEKLRSLSKDDGLLFELGNVAGETIGEMVRWNAQPHPEFVEVRYEDLIADENEFAVIFSHYSLKGAVLDAAWRAVEESRFKATTGRALGETREGDHLRSGQPGEWLHHLSEAHLERMAELYGDAVGMLGYDL
jgi:hypothetical protein